MELSAAGLNLVKVSEGFRSQTYLDVNGFPTIGYGHKILPGESFPDDSSSIPRALTRRGSASEYFPSLV